MLKKSLLSIFFIATAIVLTGCGSNDKKTAETVKQPAVQEQVDYIVTTEFPTANAEGHVEKAKPGYVKLAPNFAGDYPQTKGKIKWFTTGLGSKIPAFPEGKLLEVINTDNAFCAYIGSVDEKMFKDYFELLGNSGFHFYDYTGWDNMSLYNEQYEVNLRFGQDGYKVTTVRARILSPDEVKLAKKMIADEVKKQQAQAVKRPAEAKKAETKPAEAKK